MRKRKIETGPALRSSKKKPKSTTSRSASANTLLSTEYNEHGRRKFRISDTNNPLAGTVLSDLEETPPQRLNRGSGILREREEVTDREQPSPPIRTSPTLDDDDDLD
ncbi:hypothetical protein MMC31_000231 [Peltigera leucophlebia]|nr:hypothetical protein [Peltigera leucophlebia]